MSARQGWIADPPPPPPRDYIPGEEHKWSIMMGATNLLPAEEHEAIRAVAAKYVEEES